MVSPGLTRNMVKAMDASSIPFLPGVATPSEIVLAMELGCGFLKFFPSNLFGISFIFVQDPLHICTGYPSYFNRFALIFV